MKGLILAGGRGTRLRPLTHSGPKQLIPIANKPVLFHAIEDLKEAGIKDIGIVLGLNMPEQIRAAVGNGSKLGVRVTYIEQGEAKGLAHAIGISRDFLGDGPFVVHLGDNVLRQGIREIMNEFKGKKSDAGILLSRIKNPERFGVAEIKGGKVVRLVEKPKVPKSDLALVGVYFFTRPVFDAISQIKPSRRGELEIVDAIQRMIDSGYRVDYRIVDGWWKDMGRPEDVLEANRVFLEDIKTYNKGTIGKNVRIHGQVQIGKGTIIRGDSVIRGPVSIGEKCEIVDACIGPYSSVGSNTKIIGGEIEDSILIGDSVISCGKRIVRSLIGSNSRVVSSEKMGESEQRLIVGDNSEIEYDGQ